MPLSSEGLLIVRGSTTFQRVVAALLRGMAWNSKEGIREASLRYGTPDRRYGWQTDAMGWQDRPYRTADQRYVKADYSY